LSVLALAKTEAMWNKKDLTPFSIASLHARCAHQHVSDKPIRQNDSNNMSFCFSKISVRLSASSDLSVLALAKTEAMWNKKDLTPFSIASLHARCAHPHVSDKPTRQNHSKNMSFCFSKISVRLSASSEAMLNKKI
jgi:hypothetical protein